MREPEATMLDSYRAMMIIIITMIMIMILMIIIIVMIICLSCLEKSDDDSARFLRRSTGSTGKFSLT